MSIAARGAPAVPLVNISTARWSGVDVGDRQRVGGEQLVERDGAVDGVAVDGDDVAHGRQRDAVDGRATPPPRCGRRSTATGADGRELALELGRRARRVERHDDGTEADDGEVGDDEGVPVAADQRDPVAVADAEPGEAAAQPATGRRSSP